MESGQTSAMDRAEWLGQTSRACHLLCYVHVLSNSSSVGETAKLIGEIPDSGMPYLMVRNKFWHAWNSHNAHRA